MSPSGIDLAGLTADMATIANGGIPDGPPAPPPPAPPTWPNLAGVYLPTALAPGYYPLPLSPLPPGASSADLAAAAALQKDVAALLSAGWTVEQIGGWLAAASNYRPNPRKVK